MKRINLYHLSNIATGISATVGNFLAEAAQVCLELQGHASGVKVNISGLYKETIVIEWDKKLDRETFLSWKDEKEATEYGATAISLLMILQLEGYNFAERLPQYSVGDYFLKKTSLTNNTVKDETFLEISGIFKKSKTNTLNVRIQQKKKQLANKPIQNLNVLIAVVEFSTPKAKITKL